MKVKEGKQNAREGGNKVRGRKKESGEGKCHKIKLKEKEREKKKERQNNKKPHKLTYIFRFRYNLARYLVPISGGSSHNNSIHLIPSHWLMSGGRWVGRRWMDVRRWRGEPIWTGQGRGRVERAEVKEQERAGCLFPDFVYLLRNRVDSEVDYLISWEY